MEATKDVASAIKEIQDVAANNTAAMENTTKNINRTSELANNSSQVLESIVNIAHSTEQEIQHIAQLTEEQAQVSQELSSSMNQVHSIADETGKQVEEALNALDSLVKETEELNASPKNFKKVNILWGKKKPSGAKPLVVFLFPHTPHLLSSTLIDFVYIFTA